MSTKLRVHIRWMIRRDMPEVLKMESECFEHRWSEEDFINCLRKRNTIGMVAEFEDQIVGYMIYDLLKHGLEILNFGVEPDHQRRGVGSQMVNKLIGKLSANRRTKLTLTVRESNLDAQCFFRSQGFKAISVLRNYYDDWTTEDAYYFQYRYQPTDEDEMESLRRSAGMQ